MSRYTPDDIARLGPAAQQQIANTRFGVEEQQRQQDALSELRGRRSKYGNRKSYIDGIWWDSDAEYRRWCELRLMQRAGRISCLIRQPEYRLLIAGIDCGVYRADFSYDDVDGNHHVEDVKGVRTAVFKLKKRIVEALYNFKVEEVEA